MVRKENLPKKEAEGEARNQYEAEREKPLARLDGAFRTLQQQAAPREW